MDYMDIKKTAGAPAQPEILSPGASGPHTQVSARAFSPEPHDFANDIIELDVGGKLYKTHRSTLMAQPGYLAELVDPQSEFAKPKEANRYFIDRDGEHFGHILNYLRTPKLNKALKPEVVSALRIEADFYLLSDLVTELKFIYPARLAKNKAKQSEDENMIVVKHLDYYMSIFLYQDQTRGTKKLMKIYNKPPTDDIWQICSAYTEGKKFPSDGRKAEYHVHKKMLQKGFAFFDVEDTRKTIMREFKSLITMEWDSREWPRHLLDAIR